MFKNLFKILSFILFSLCLQYKAYCQDTLSVVKTGHISSDSLFKLVYVPIVIPGGIKEIQVKEIYTESGDPTKNVLNIGIFDSRGHDVGNPLGFRGWSGGSKKYFFINSSNASPGYLQGKISSGIWHVLIYPSTITSSGLDWRLEIKLVKGEDQSAEPEGLSANDSINNKPGWYRGDLHTHTLHSDGKRNEQDLVNEAKVKNLDYIISTEHNTNSANQNWGKYQAGTDLLIINGEEVTTTEFGHWNAIGLKADTYIDWRYSPEDNRIAGMVDKVHRDGGLAIINHPFYHVKLINSFKYEVELFDGIEVWNGKWNKLNNLALIWWDELLRKGHKIIAIGASDTHKTSGSPNNLGEPQTVVFAAQLSKQGIMDGIKKGRVYITSNDRISLHFTAKSGKKNAELGDNLSLKSNQKVGLLLDIKNCKNHKVTLIDENGVLKSRLIESVDESLQWSFKDFRSKFVRIEVRTTDDLLVAMTNPIFFTSDIEGETPAKR